MHILDRAKACQTCIISINSHQILCFLQNIVFVVYRNYASVGVFVEASSIWSKPFESDMWLIKSWKLKCIKGKEIKQDKFTLFCSYYKMARPTVHLTEICSHVPCYKDHIGHGIA